MTVFLRHTLTPVAYETALELMQERVHAIQKGKAPELVWFLEHPPVYTMGSRGLEDPLHQIAGIPVVETGRGGQMTYHGPGQRVVYVCLDLRKRGPDLRAYIQTLGQWVQAALLQMGLNTRMDVDRIGLWVPVRDGYEEKVCALGVRVQKWVTSHGVAINVTNDLEPFQRIVPCGITHHGVTSLSAQGLTSTLADLDRALQDQWPRFFQDALREEYLEDE